MAAGAASASAGSDAGCDMTGVAPERYRRKLFVDRVTPIVMPPQTAHRAPGTPISEPERSRRGHRSTFRTGTFTPPPSRSQIRTGRRWRRISRPRVRPAIDRVYRAWQRLGVTLHFPWPTRSRAACVKCRRSLVTTPIIATVINGTMKLSPAILAEEISGAAVLLRVLIWNQRVEDRHDLSADVAHAVDWNDEDKSSPPMCDKASPRDRAPSPRRGGSAPEFG